jgi:hypothetical protein
MELSAKQIQLINLVLPKGWKIENTTKRDTRPRRSEADNLNIDAYGGSLGKRPVRERKPVTYEEPEVKKPTSGAYNKAMNLLRQLKKHPNVEPFLEPVNLDANPDYLSVV